MSGHDGPKYVTTDKAGMKAEISRRATCMFRQISEKWLCVVDNSYGTTLLDSVVES